jgi:S-adenosylmethionine hydrolase
MAIQSMMKKMKPRIIALLTDFGGKDYFVASLKAVILSINPRVEIVDISHEVEAYNRLEAAFLLKAVAPYFPQGTIFLAVVDPGVGSDRKIILVKGKKHFFTGPDNGLLIPAAEEEGLIEVRELRAEKYFLPSWSRTFEGRDKMAPAVAWLSRGVPFESFGPIAASFEKLVFPEPSFLPLEIRAEVIHSDRFGNLITSIPVQPFLDWFKKKKESALILSSRKRRWPLQYVPAFAYGLSHQPLILPGSSGFMEIGWKEASAASHLRIRPGDKITIKMVKSKKSLNKNVGK